MIPKEFREYLCGYKTVRFHFRLQKEVAAYFRDRKRNGNYFSGMCSAAVDRFQIALSQGFINLKRTSRFREREDRADKIECIANLETVAKDLVEKLAFTLRLSQAEVLRMAMEWWMETVLLRKRREISIPARWKWHHRSRTPRVETLTFSFWSFGRELIWRFHPPRPKKFPFPPLSWEDWED
ncbi:MAG: hypothetical protein LBC99_05800 [Spirochaetota bacterium]|jgi:hypothetical protein|nr:hypothetical protein [Spirochaetota bacterium]